MDEITRIRNRIDPEHRDWDDLASWHEAVGAVRKVLAAYDHELARNRELRDQIRIRDEHAARRVREISDQEQELNRLRKKVRDMEAEHGS